MKYFTIPQAARLIHVSNQKVYNWIYNGQLPAIDIGGERGLRVKEADLDTFLERFKISDERLIEIRRVSYGNDITSKTSQYKRDVKAYQ